MSEVLAPPSLTVTHRSFCQNLYDYFVAQDLHPILARSLAARQIQSLNDVSGRLSNLHPPQDLLNLTLGSQIIGDAIIEKKIIVIIGDYDCDGATATAIAVRGLKKFGSRVFYIVPEREENGYGLTPQVIDRAIEKFSPDVLITVDNGITSNEGVQYAKDKKLTVIITDHHLPVNNLPIADCIINPNQPNCSFPSKSLCGAGVIFYTLIGVRSYLKQQNFFQEAAPSLSDLLDLVAIGTIADIVRLDRNNRILVSAGLHQIRQGLAQPGVAALIKLARCPAQYVNTNDLAFMIAPRINAAGRLASITLSIDCLIHDDPDEATSLAKQLEKLNSTRKIMAQKAYENAYALADIAHPDDPFFCLFHPSWLIGMTGLIAGHLKEVKKKPTIVFAQTKGTELRGSGRSSPHIPLDTILMRINQESPTLLKKFGGHPCAAGLTIEKPDLETFQNLLMKHAGPCCKAPELELLIDGEITAEDLDPKLIEQLNNVCWGMDFEEPLFISHVVIESVHPIGKNHLGFKLRLKNKRIQAYQWGKTDYPDQASTYIAYHLGYSHFRNYTHTAITIRSWL